MSFWWLFLCILILHKFMWVHFQIGHISICFRMAHLYIRQSLQQDISWGVCMGWFHLSHLLFQMIFISILLYNLCVTQLTFIKFVVLHLLAFFFKSLLFLYLCDACCDHVKFLFFIFVVDIRVSGVGVLLCFVGNVFFVSDTGKRVLRTLPRPTRTGGYKY